MGIKEAASFPSIAVCEGGADLLAAFHFLIEQGRAGDCAPVAVLGSKMSIHGEALPLFAGKRVRIFQHADESGARASARWREQLSRAGAAVDLFSLAGLSQADGSPVKDLNDLAHVLTADFASFPCLSHLFP